MADRLRCARWRPACRPCSPACPPMRKPPRRPRRDRRHRAEAHGKPAVRADQHPGARHAAPRGAERTDFDDYVKFLPSVSYQTAGPGFAQVYMRGVASGGDGNHSGSLPSVGIYLDEQPITTIQGALDVHLYDIQRVEALAGPQGTLYGASSQAGTMRIITNKPDASAFDAGYGLEVNSVDGGGIGYLAEGIVNLPINDRSAVRLVGWHRHDAGYIDNVYRERTFPTSDITVDNARLRRRQLQRSRHHGRPCGAAARPHRQLDHHPAAHGAEAGSQRQLGLRHDRRRARDRPRLSGDLGRPLDAGGADRRRQGRQPRPDLRRFLPEARRRHRVGLLRLLVLVRHALSATAPTG